MRVLERNLRFIGFKKLRADSKLGRQVSDAADLLQVKLKGNATFGDTESGGVTRTLLFVKPFGGRETKAGLLKSAGNYVTLYRKRRNLNSDWLNVNIEKHVGSRNWILQLKETVEPK